MTQQIARSTTGRGAHDHVHRSLRALAAYRMALTVAGGRSPRARRERERRDAFHRGIWLVAAANLGLPADELGGSAVEIALGDTVLRVSRGATSLETGQAFGDAGNKPLVHRLLAEAGIPVPAHRVTTLDTLTEVLPFVAASPGSVVKPALDGSGGRGVTTQVHTPTQVRTAAIAAAAAAALASRTSTSAGGSRLTRLGAKLSELGRLPLLVEEQVPGDNYRLLYLDGRLVDAVRRARPAVVGDGRSTVQQLVERVNDLRGSDPVERGGASITVDPDLVATLGQQRMALSSIPAAGQRVPVKTAVNEGAIADHVSATDLLCPSIVDDAAVAASVVGTRLVGVDVITTDPSLPLRRTGGCVLEINTTPGLAYHYHHGPGQTHVTREILGRLMRG